MKYADLVGLPTVCERICEFEKQHGELRKLAPLLSGLPKRRPLSWPTTNRACRLWQTDRSLAVAALQSAFRLLPIRGSPGGLFPGLR